MRQLDGTTDSMDISLSKLKEMVKDRKPGMLHFAGHKESDMTELTTNITYEQGVHCPGPGGDPND